MSSNEKKDSKKKPLPEGWKPDKSQIHIIELGEKPSNKKEKKTHDEKTRGD